MNNFLSYFLILLITPDNRFQSEVPHKNEISGNHSLGDKSILSVRSP